MKTIIHRAKSRGHIDRGWSDSYLTFSFSEYFNAERIHFGALRVLNDDTIVPGGKGFGPHIRYNMETISIPLEGELDHEDGLGNHETIRSGEIQVMSTGSGVRHSEGNKNHDKPVRFLQIWIVPNQNNLEPRYEHLEIEGLLIPNRLNEIVKPAPGDGRGAWINQQAWLSRGRLDKGMEVSYVLKSKDSYGVYLFVIEGEVSVDDDLELFPCDGTGILNAASFRIRAIADADVLLIEVPKLK